MFSVAFLTCFGDTGGKLKPLKAPKKGDKDYDETLQICRRRKMRRRYLLFHLFVFSSTINSILHLVVNLYGILVLCNLFPC
jgi:hypothetical protein